MNDDKLTRRQKWAIIVAGCWALLLITLLIFNSGCTKYNETKEVGVGLGDSPTCIVVGIPDTLYVDIPITIDASHSFSNNYLELDSMCVRINTYPQKTVMYDTIYTEEFTYSEIGWAELIVTVYTKQQMWSGCQIFKVYFEAP